MGPGSPEKAQRRRYSAAYKLQILEEADRATEPGQIGALLRREGLYSSLLAAWRQQRRDGTLAGQGRGRKGKDQRDRKIEELERDNARLAKKLDQAETIIEVQKNSRGCWGSSRRPTPTPRADDGCGR
ncbi:MAG: transposase [Actinobacteria bacterium]|nr:transposase [Actinomycetota bacterium]